MATRVLRRRCCHAQKHIYQQYGPQRQHINVLMTTLSRGSVRGLRSQSGDRHKFAVAFDIDGVLIRGRGLIEGAKEGLKRLRDAEVSVVYLTNGGGCTEAAKAAELSEKFGLTVQRKHVILSHSPMRKLSKIYKDKRVMVIGSNGKEIAKVDLGLDKVIDPYDLCHEHDHIYHFTGDKYYIKRHYPHTPQLTSSYREPVQAVMVLHDPLDWALEAQIVLDVLKGRHLPPGTGPLEEQTPFYISNPDLTFASTYPAPRLAAGAFAEVVQVLYKRVYQGKDCHIEHFGKPTFATFSYAQQRLEALSQRSLERIYMVGDNPEGDIRGANNAGAPWVSNLVRTGLFTGTGNDAKDPAAFVHDDVNAFVTWVLEREEKGDRDDDDDR